jgi:hypothetical protein
VFGPLSEARERERARERESERARARESERARERESESARERESERAQRVSLRSSDGVDAYIMHTPAEKKNMVFVD